MPVARERELTAFRAPAATPALAARLLTALERRLGPALAFCECWDEEVCAVGVAAPGGAHRLAFLSIDPAHPDRYYVLLDAPDGDPAERREAVGFDALCEAVAGCVAG